MYDRETARRELGVTKPLLVSFWGSLGAREMNKKIAQFMKLECEEKRYRPVPATGSFGWRWMLWVAFWEIFPSAVLFWRTLF